jgi:hypothetical protein
MWKQADGVVPSLCESLQRKVERVHISGTRFAPESDLRLFRDKEARMKLQHLALGLISSASFLSMAQGELIVHSWFQECWAGVYEDGNFSGNTLLQYLPGEQRARGFFPGLDINAHIDSGTSDAHAWANADARLQVVLYPHPPNWDPSWPEFWQRLDSGYYHILLQIEFSITEAATVRMGTTIWNRRSTDTSFTESSEVLGPGRYMRTLFLGRSWTPDDGVIDMETHMYLRIPASGSGALMLALGSLLARRRR